MLGSPWRVGALSRIESRDFRLTPRIASLAGRPDLGGGAPGAALMTDPKYDAANYVIIAPLFLRIVFFIYFFLWLEKARNNNRFDGY